MYATEAQEQQAVFDGLLWQLKPPQIVIAFPNHALHGAGTSKDRIGAQKGVSDTFSPNPTVHHPSAWSELKRQRGYYPKKSKYRWPGATQSQLNYLHARGLEGCAVSICYGAEQQIEFYLRYFQGEYFSYKGQFDCEGERG